MSTDPITLRLSLAQVNQILAALGAQPYQDVFRLIGEIQQQAEGQLGEDAPDDGGDAP